MIEWGCTFVRRSDGRASEDLAEVYSWCTDPEREKCSGFFARYPRGKGIGDLTPVAGIASGPGPVRPVPAAGNGGIGECLLRTLGRPHEAHVAVSGGIDCWLLAAMLLRAGVRVHAWTLRTGIAGYCEYDQARRMGRALGVPVECTDASYRDFPDALPDFTAAVQFPVYNLHPVSKLLLARAFIKQGITEVITGDGADQVARHDQECDLLPLTLSAFRSQGVRVNAPFLDPAVQACFPTRDPDKSRVRALALALGVPAVPKRSTMFPDVPGCLEHSFRLLEAHLEARTLCAESRA